MVFRPAQPKRARTPIGLHAARGSAYKDRSDTRDHFSEFGDRSVFCRQKALGLFLVVVPGIAALSPAAHAGDPLDGRRGTRTAPIILLTRQDVQADLRLSPELIADANRTGAEIYQKALALKGKDGAAVVEARRAIDREASLWLTSNLTERQLSRLDQIDLQWEGMSAMLSRPFIADYMGLTPDQRRALARIIASHADPRRAQTVRSPSDQGKLAHDALAVLSDRQQQLWSRLLGTPFQFSGPLDAQVKRAGSVSQRVTPPPH
jgi:hypothetical protein